MRVSVIMPSFLGEYKGCASNREDKFVRAINSFLSNTYQNKELVIVGDNCVKTETILFEKYNSEIKSGKILFKQLRKKQKLFSGKLRTNGINMATGDLIMYLDSDDMYGDNHIQTVVEQVKALEIDWCYFNDFINTDGGLMPKSVELEHKSIGTSSIAHLKHKDIDWYRCNGYGHDWKFVKKLMNWSYNYEKIFGTSYIICHIPNQIDR